MCGIFGSISLSSDNPFGLSQVPFIIKSLNQRGPDNSGHFIHKNILLVHTRLSIIDTSQNGNQPMEDESGRYVIIYNGEIYNHKEIKSKLIEKGIKFFSNSDTEVLLKAYIFFGVECLKMLNGFFSFAILDKSENTLFIARDRIGIKPLHFYQDNEKIVFASELKALLSAGINKELNYHSLALYFHLNYIPAPFSIFKSVRKIEPGNYVIIKNGRVEEKKYYSVFIPDDSNNNKVIGFKHASRDIRTLIHKSVQNRLISDVPLGAYLSGGIDSSIICYHASQQKNDLQTFTIGFENEPEFNESQFAEIVAKKFKTQHQTFKLTKDDLYKELFNVLDYLDEPFGDSSALPVFILSKLTRNSVKVALSGDGGDELFGGYNKYFAEFLLRKWKFFLPLLSFVNPLLSFFPQSKQSNLANAIRKLKRFSNNAYSSAEKRYWDWCGFLMDNEVNDLLNHPQQLSDFSNTINYFTRFVNDRKGINDILYSDMHLSLPGDMLNKIDLMSMANSLEVRVPFLDHNLVDYAFSLSSNYKISGITRKQILRYAYRKIIPPEIMSHRKQGFEVPLLNWFRNELDSFLWQDLLYESKIREQNLFNYEKILEFKNKLKSKSPGDITSTIWSLLVFQYWYRKYME
ncbi:MAG: asparagine synthase (glutamine-hydrolyzing) [Bacteroidetes bacterium RIFCSPLOWO2_02_FULL_36_8]|nr:MAG: asparagine synthase (glutamine-hydrolyzing) [Bacteroidetes bacterium RIFCSPLOWO2_02_FULL_36_8]OFY71481.1 MAG: asparagine synthase (glutamine-hydrolyzing) [Bacteroidetes bacterium RIFCSPLOWO2_12_FULL_37_12]